ncbi:hypothetical protein FE784_02705 [Paenibacillus hemerocallicola]|uniref:Uncharacterized protein n=1 Tax=Paenibacillus hemerocallicola TaxID=1172614 RepID=A0A5C4TH44_9BACL|nr:hypothetical protein FE784_02705 [Paenibacillus hemerocallicola]
MNDRLPGFRAFGLSGFRAFGLSGFRAFGLSGFRAFGAPSISNDDLPPEYRLTSLFITNFSN